MPSTLSARPVGADRPVPFWRPRRVAALAVAALALATYLNALDNPFVYDDFWTVTGNPSISATASPRWTVGYMPFRPVVNISYAIDRAVWGYRPFGYHLTSLLLHAGVSVLLFLFLLRLLDDIRPASPSRLWSTPQADTWAAFAGAALFAVHPMQAESAGYVSARSELLCGLFILGALLLARLACRPADPGRSAPHWRALTAAAAVGCALLAMLSKEVAASLPILLVAYDWLILPGSRASKRRRLAMVFVPLTLITALAVLYRVRSLAGLDATLSTDPILNLLTQGIVIWRYLAMMVVPAGQAIVHATRTVTNPADPQALLAAAGLVGLVFAAFTLRRVSPLYPLGILWWFACIAPSSSIIALREGMAEHRVYVASAGLAVVVAAVSRQLLARHSGRSPGIPAWFKAGLAAVLLVSASLTVARNAVWDSQVSVWREALAVSPGVWQSRYALADALRETGDCVAALPEYEGVLRDHPDHREGLTNYGICLGQLNRLPEAAAAFKRALAVDPLYGRGYTNLAAVALLEGNIDQARAHYEHAIVVDPTNVHARLQLARMFADRLQDFARAARLCEEARAISPSTPGVGACVDRNQALARAANRGGQP